MNSVGLKQHINALMPLFDQFGHPLGPAGEKTGKIETSSPSRYHKPQPRHATL
jgi:hypothetical protein